MFLFCQLCTPPEPGLPPALPPALKYYKFSKMSDLYLSRIRSWFLSSPPAEWALNRLRSTLIGALSQGPIPRHVAFEMDGNRRYARSHKIETIEGHHLGFEALARVRPPAPWPRTHVLDRDAELRRA